MRYPASEKLEIIRTVEGSHLPTKQTLDMLGIPRSTFYRWYDLYLEDGLDGLSDKSPCPKSVWNRIPDGHRNDLIEFALEHEALTTRELAVKYTDEKRDDHIHLEQIFSNHRESTGYVIDLILGLAM